MTSAPSPPIPATSNIASTSPVLIFDNVRVWTASGANILLDLSWTVEPGEHWALLGPNGAGKSTLLALAGAVRHPSAGSVDVLGCRLGRVDMPALRRNIGVVDPNHRLLPWLTVADVVLTGLTGTIRPLWDQYGPPDQTRARHLLALVGAADLADHLISTCSQGERQRVSVARALMPDPPLLLLDEPATGLDLPAREALLSALAGLASTHRNLASVFVTHHLEELPVSTTHVMLLRHGSPVAVGPITETLTNSAVSVCFGLPVTVDHHDGRWSARAAPGWRNSDDP
jgi:iron complex transport system ATP-binding protein